MNNKKLIFGILLFCAISFLAFTFANPKETGKEDGTLIQNGGSSTTNSTDKTDADKNKVQTPVKIDDEKKPEESTTPTQATTQTTNRYTASNNNYYSGGSSNNNNGSSNNGGGSYTPPATEPSVPENPTPSVPQEPVKEKIGIASVSAQGTSTETISMEGIYASQSGTTISIGGVIERRVSENGVSTKPVMTLTVVAPKVLDRELLVNAKYKYNSNDYGFSTSAVNMFGKISNLDKLDQEKAKFNLIFEYDKSLFKSEFGTLSLSIDWGDGEFTDYTIDFSNVTIKYLSE